jgi:hypothetical protein
MEPLPKEPKAPAAKPAEKAATPVAKPVEAVAEKPAVAEQKKEINNEQK